MSDCACLVRLHPRGAIGRWILVDLEEGPATGGLQEGSPIRIVGNLDPRIQSVSERFTPCGGACTVSIGTRFRDAGVDGRFFLEPTNQSIQRSQTQPRSAGGARSWSNRARSRPIRPSICRQTSGSRTRRFAQTADHSRQRILSLQRLWLRPARHCGRPPLPGMRHTDPSGFPIA